MECTSLAVLILADRILTLECHSSRIKALCESHEISRVISIYYFLILIRCRFSGQLNTFFVIECILGISGDLGEIPSSSLAYSLQFYNYRLFVSSNVDNTIMPSFAALSVRTEVDRLLAGVRSVNGIVIVHTFRIPCLALAFYFHYLERIVLSQREVQHVLCIVLRINGEGMCFVCNNSPFRHRAYEIILRLCSSGSKSNAVQHCL